MIVSELLPEEKLLLDAAEWFEQVGPEGWNQYASGAPSGTAKDSHCALGALGHAAGVCRASNWDDSYDRALARLQRIVGGPVPLWNDYQAESVYDVIDAMRRAAKPEFRDE